MSALFRVDNAWVDAGILTDRQLLAEQQLNREFDVAVDIDIQLDKWENPWYNSNVEAA